MSISILIFRIIQFKELQIKICFCQGQLQIIIKGQTTIGIRLTQHSLNLFVNQTKMIKMPNLIHLIIQCGKILNRKLINIREIKVSSKVDFYTPSCPRGLAQT